MPTFNQARYDLEHKVDYERGALPPQSAGQILVSNGASLAPSYQSVAAIQIAPTVLSGSTDALGLNGFFPVTTAGVNAMTLATPTAGAPGTGDDGKVVEVVDIGGHAHTITTADEKIAGINDLLTFNGTAGSYVRLRAYNGFWYVVGSAGVTASDA